MDDRNPPSGASVPSSPPVVKYPLNFEGVQYLQKLFTYHAPMPGQPERYAFIRQTALQFAIHIKSQTPVSREQSLALTKLEEVVMWANAAIARGETTFK